MPVVYLDERRKRPPNKPPRKPLGFGWFVAIGVVAIAVIAFCYYWIIGPT